MNQTLPHKPFIAFLVLLSAIFAQDHTPLPFSADYTVTRDGKEAATGKMYLEWPKFRQDIKDAKSGITGSAIIDYATHKAISLMPQYQTYTELSLDQAQPIKSVTPMNLDPANPCSGHPKWSCKKLPPETLSGRPCAVWEIATNEMGLVTIWIDTKLNFPIKSKAANGYAMEYTNIHEAPPDPAVFKIPAGYKKTARTPRTAFTPKPQK